MWIAIIIVYVLLSILAGIGARNKGRSFAGFFLLSLLLSPLVGLIAMAVVKRIEKPATAPSSSAPISENASAPDDRDKSSS